MVGVADMTPEESIQQNKETWCMEVGSEFEKYSQLSVDIFVKFIGKNPVVDLGAGDGAGTNAFLKNGNKVVAVDINPEKLACIKGKTVEMDIKSYLNGVKSVDNVFMHHVLEHIVNYQDILDLIALKLKKGGYAFIAVPKDDHVHSVHHVAFSSYEEIVPPGLEVVERWESSDPWPEYGVIVRK